MSPDRDRVQSPRPDREPYGAESYGGGVEAPPSRSDAGETRAPSSSGSLDASTTAWTATRPLDVSHIRQDFPILKRTVHGSRLVYLDNAATTQKPRQVIEALTDFYRNTNANIHRGLHTLSAESTHLYEQTRSIVARFLGGVDPTGIVFTRNCTEAINLVAHAWGRKYLQPGDEVLLTEMEHHSNLVPWILLAEETGAVLRHIPVLDDGTLDLEEAERLVSSRTKLLSMVMVSNALGTINPVGDVVALARRVGATVLLDGAQAVPHLPVNARELDVDFLAFSAHKMLGPTGVGVLYGRPEILAEMRPFLGGGEMIREVHLDRATWNDVPFKFEAGTPNIADVVAFGAAVAYLEAFGMAAVRAHETELMEYALSEVRKIPSIRVYGPGEAGKVSGVLSFTDADIHPHDLSQVLDESGVAIRAGHHCAQPLMRRFGTVATARASFYIYNGRDDVDAWIEALRTARRYFGH